MKADSQNIFRANVIENLETLASPELQLKFQADVPFVNISVELACNWFDGSYLPEYEEFIAAFSAAEVKAMADFNAIFNGVTATFDQADYPEIHELLHDLEWLRVVEAAGIAIKVFERN